MKRILTFATITLLFWTAAAAQLPMLRNFTTLYYKAGTQNWAIDQAEDGTMLYANNDGLLTFDGSKWNVWQVPNYTNVRAVQYEEATKRTYVTATDEFGYFKGNPKTHQLQYTSLSSKLPGKYKNFGEVWKIVQFDGGRAFQAKSQVFIQHKGGDKFTTVNVPYLIENASAVNGQLYISCLECIYIYKGGKLVPAPGLEALKNKAVRAMLPYRGKTLIVTANNGLYLYDGHECKEYLLDVSPLLKENQVFCAAISSKYLLFGTVRNGLIMKDMTTGRNYFLNNVSGLCNNTVLSIQFDKLGNIWLGLDNGISYIMPAAPCLNLLGTNSSIGTGYASLLHEGHLYLGTNQGLYLINYPISDELTQPKPIYVTGITGQVWNLSEIDGNVLCGGDQGGYTLHGNTATPINGMHGTWGFLPIKGHPGYLLGCEYNGFVVLKQEGDGLVVKNRVKGLDMSTGGCLVDYDGSFWMSHWQRGVYHFKLSDDLTQIVGLEYFHRGNGLPIDDNNLVCTIGGKVYTSSVDGFRIYNPKTRKLDKAQWLNNTFNEYGTSLRVIETPGGDLWAYKPGYLVIAVKQASGKYKVEHFTYANVVDRLQMSLGRTGMIDAGHTLMNYEDGFFLVSNHFVADRKTNQLFIRDIYGTNDQDTLLFSHYPGQQEREITIPHSLNSIRIEYVMPEYQEDKAVTYSYYLENYDKSWSTISTNTSKEYTRLPKGKYIFHVKAHDRINDSTSEVAFKIEILPAWYETWWAYCIYLILGAIAIWEIVQYTQRRTQNQVRKAQIEKEREMHAKELQFQIEEQKKEKELIKLRNEHLEIELKHKSSELADSTMNLVRKNDILREIDLRMEELSTELTKEKNKTATSKIIRDVRHSIQRNIKEDDNWEKFQENFNLVYNNFLNKLVERYPLLKLNDLKLCAYLRMELSSKEMAALLNTSARSVETARYRLRKKLNLAQGENLTDFIKNFDSSSSGQQAEEPDTK